MKITIARIMSFLVTFGPIGYLPASGTIASLVTIPFLFWVPQPYIFFVPFFVVLCVSSLFMINYVCNIYDLPYDSATIVIDELCGMLLVFHNIPLTIDNIIVGFLAFRFFDISKFGGAHILERLPSPYGVVADDLLAGLYAHILLRLYLYFCC